MSYSFLIGVLVFVSFYALKYIKRDNVQRYFRSCGRGVRTVFENNGYANNIWLYFLEPVIVQQLVVLINSINAFLEGLVDNSDLLKRIEVMNKEVTNKDIKEEDSDSSDSSDDEEEEVKEVEVKEVEVVEEVEEVEEEELEEVEEVEVEDNNVQMVDEVVDMGDLLKHITSAFDQFQGDFKLGELNMDDNSMHQNMLNRFNMEDMLKMGELAQPEIDNSEFGDLLSFSDSEVEPEVPVVDLEEPVVELPVVDLEEPVVELPVVELEEPVVELPVVDLEEPVVEEPVVDLEEPKVVKLVKEPKVEEEPVLNELMIDNSEITEEIEDYTEKKKGKFKAKMTGNSVKITAKKPRKRKKKSEN